MFLNMTIQSVKMAISHFAYFCRREDFFANQVVKFMLRAFDPVFVEGLDVFESKNTHKTTELRLYLPKDFKE